MPLDTLWWFVVASIALGFAPGPDNIFVLTQSSQHGARAGLLVTLGLCTGLIFHTGLVVFGVAVIFQTSLVVFTAVKIIGAGYLLYLAWQAFRAARAELGSIQVSAGRLYQRGVIMNLTNPKVAIFFLAFLPQFVDPDLGQGSRQIVILGMIFIGVTLLVFGSIAMAAGRLSSWFTRSPQSQQWLNRIAGSVFVALALRLLIIEQQ